MEMTIEPMLAAFVSPALFAGGAAAVAAPIIIHLLARRRFTRIRWAAMDFLVDAQRRNRRRIQMEEWILLAVRCLAVLLIAGIVSRPFLQPGAMASALGGLRQTERVFVIDDSYSMAYLGDDGPVFEQARTAVARLMELMRKESPDDTVTILRMSDVASPIESGTYLDAGQIDEVLGRLDGLSPSNRSIEPRTVIRGVADYLGQAESVVSAAVYFISDFQRHDWTAPAVNEPGADDPGLFAPLVNWAGEDRALQLMCVNVGDEDAVNLAITEVGLSTGRIVAGATGRIQVSMINHANEAADGQSLSVTLGQRLPRTEPVPTLPAGMAVTSELDVEFAQPGYEAIAVRLGEDRLGLDNTRYHVAEVAGAIKVLVVNGEPFPDVLRDETGFLATALRPEGDVFSGHECTVIDEAQLETTAVSEFHVVILANVYRVSEPVVEKLERLVRRGGGLLFFLGDQVDPDGYNTGLYRDGKGVLPVALGQITRPQRPVHLQITDAMHPVTRGLAGGGASLGVGTILFDRFFGCTVDQAGAADGDGAGALSRVQILARFTDPAESPAIILGRLGKGRVLVVTTAMDKEWGRWPDHPSYLPAVSEMVRYVAASGGDGDAHWVGSTIELPIDPAIFLQDAIVRTPAFPAEREYNVTASVTDNADGLAVAWPQTAEPGIYEFVLQRRDGVSESRRIAVNVDPGEGDLARCSEADLTAAAGDAKFVYIDGLAALREGVDAARAELWRVLLFGAVMILMTEQCLAWWFGSRR